LVGYQTQAKFISLLKLNKIVFEKLLKTTNQIQIKLTKDYKHQNARICGKNNRWIIAKIINDLLNTN